MDIFVHLPILFVSNELSLALWVDSIYVNWGLGANIDMMAYIFAHSQWHKEPVRANSLCAYLVRILAKVGIEVIYKSKGWVKGSGVKQH